MPREIKKYQIYFEIYKSKATYLFSIFISIIFSFMQAGCTDRCEGPQITQNDATRIAIQHIIKDGHNRNDRILTKINDYNSFINEFSDACCTAFLENTKRYDTLLMYREYYAVYIRYNSRTEVITISKCGNRL